MKFLAIVAVIFLAAGLHDAETQFMEGDFDSSFQGFEEEARAKGLDASAELHVNVALSALKAGRFKQAEIAMEKAVAAGGTEFAGLRSFIFGNTAFARCLEAEKLTKRVEAGLPAFDDAISACVSACRSWQEAIMSEPDWPEACRNLERGLKKLEVLAKARQEFLKKSKKDKNPNEKDKKQGENDENGEGKKSEVEEEALADLSELDRSALSQLLKKLKEKENKKRADRLRRRGATKTTGGNDW